MLYDSSMEINKKGKMIVIEGGDGSGKGTQTEMLIAYCKENNIPYAHLEFPNYDSFFGKLVAKFLRGELGTLEEVSPYFASLPFALDRNATKETTQKYLDEGKIVIVNRYVSSNMAHQGSKFTDIQERDEFLKWLEQLEYSIHGIPKPDLQIFLYMPWEQAKELTKHKGDRSYLNGEAQDIQEADDSHRLKTEEMYELLAKQNDSWRTINCVENGTILSKDMIHSRIIDLLRDEHILD